MFGRIPVWCFIFLFSLNCFAAQAQGGPFTLTGKIKGQQTGIVVLSYTGKNVSWVNDTCVLQKGKFHFAGDIGEPVIAYLRGAVRSQADNDSNATSFYIEPTQMAITLERDHFKEMKITGSKNQQEYEELQKKIKSIPGKGEGYFQQLMETVSDFITVHPSSYVSAFELLLLLNQLQLDTANKLYHKLTPAVQQSNYGKAIYPRLSQMLGSLPGRMAADFTSTDIDNQPLTLSLFKGRYVVLDFWASWCMPCREAAPHWRAQFAKYHNLGLEIIGIADDDDHPDLWKKAVHYDSVYVWFNVLRGLKKDKNGNDDRSVSINDQYGIGVLPSKILIGRDGVIIGRYEGEQEDAILDKKLKEIFKQ